VQKIGLQIDRLKRRRHKSQVLMMRVRIKEIFIRP